MTLLGRPLHDLEQADVQAFLDTAHAEPLLWEAKGTELDRHEVRRQVCGFANGLQTAYLILGASCRDGGWVLEAMDFGGDPPAWVTSVIGERLSPLPRVDVGTVELEGGGQLAVVEVPPIAIPPCICAGTVFERVSGRTIPVKDPNRLAELYGRGRSAREGAIAAARTHAAGVLGDPDAPGYGSPFPRFALALSATGHPADISSRLFSERFEEQMVAVVQRDLVPPLPGTPPAYATQIATSFEQSNRRLDCEDRIGHGKPCYWHVRVIWDGTVVVCGAWDIDSVPAQALFEKLISSASRTAAALLDSLGGYGPRHLELRIDAAEALIGASRGNPNPPITIGYGPAEDVLAPEVFDRVERELRRSTGERVFEPI